MTASIIVYAPQGSGLGEDMVNKLRKHFGLTRVYDCDCPPLYVWPRNQLPEQDYLIVAHTPEAPRTKLRTFSFSQALKAMKGGAK